MPVLAQLREHSAEAKPRLFFRRCLRTNNASSVGSIKHSSRASHVGQSRLTSDRRRVCRRAAGSPRWIGAELRSCDRTLVSEPSISAGVRLARQETHGPRPATVCRLIRDNTEQLFDTMTANQRHDPKPTAGRMLKSSHAAKPSHPIWAGLRSERPHALHLSTAPQKRTTRSKRNFQDLLLHAPLLDSSDSEGAVFLR
jgi:hypothetical protein